MRKQKEPRLLALTSRLVVSGQTVDVQVSQINGIRKTKKASCQAYLPVHSSIHKILLRPCKSDNSQYRLINALSPLVQEHLSQLKPEVEVEAFVLDSKSEHQDGLDDFIFGELASVLPKPQNSKTAKYIITKLAISTDLLDLVIEGFELDTRSPNEFPTKAIAKLLGIAPGTVTTILKDVKYIVKWNRYAKTNNLSEYLVMIQILDKLEDQKYKNQFIGKLRQLEVNSPEFEEFAFGANNYVKKFLTEADNWTS